MRDLTLIFTLTLLGTGGLGDGVRDEEEEEEEDIYLGDFTDDSE